MTTLNYTTTTGDPALDAAFEQALATARAGRPEPLPHLIGGREVADGELFERADPCDPSRVVSRAHKASPEVVADAVAAARAAQPGWAATPLAERVAALRRMAKLIGERTVEMGAIVSAETGKVRLESVPEVQEGVDLIEAYCGHMERNDGYVIPLGQLSEEERNTSVMLPYGVFAVICPFNFPFALAVGMSSGALVTGNTVVMKPAEETPWSTGVIAELAVQAGLPPGVLNLVQGDDETGRALIGADIDGVAFTGSAEAGHAIAQRLHETRPLRPLIVEMGGKNPADRHGARGPRDRRGGHRPLGLRAVGPEVQLVLARGRRAQRARRAGGADRRRSARAGARRSGRPRDVARARSRAPARPSASTRRWRKPAATARSCSAASATAAS